MFKSLHQPSFIALFVERWLSDQKSRVWNLLIKASGFSGTHLQLLLCLRHFRWQFQTYRTYARIAIASSGDRDLAAHNKESERNSCRRSLRSVPSPGGIPDKHPRSMCSRRSWIRSIVSSGSLLDHLNSDKASNTRSQKIFVIQTQNLGDTCLVALAMYGLVKE